jgi:hypothetical protein
VRRVLASLGEYDQEQMEHDQSHFRTLASAAIVGGLVALGHELLFNPHPTAPPQGEFDPTNLVGTGLVAQALAIAGGDENATRTAAGGVIGSDGSPVGGVGLGPTVTDTLTQLGLFQTRTYWLHGDPPRDFEPHVELDGIEFEGDNDDLLANDYGWPDVDYFYPKDHEGCDCEKVPVYEMNEDAIANDEEAA